MRISVSRTALLIMVLLGTATAVLLCTRVASAESAKPSLSILPGEISLAPSANEGAEVTLIAGVPVSGVLSATLTSLRSDDYVVTILPPQTVVRPSGDIRFAALITRTPASRSPGQALFALQYVTIEGPNGQSTHIITAALPIANGASASPVLSISLQTVTNTLLDRRSRNAFLVLANTSDSDVLIDRIQALSEGFVAVEFTPPLIFPLTVGAQRSAIVTLTVAARDQVQPGNWFVLVQVDSNWERDKRHFQASQIIRSDLDVGVYGENDILKALALPILLLLPGAIFVWVLGKFLGKRIQAQAEMFKFDFAATRDFAAATIITSILIVIFYRFAGGVITKVLFGVSVSRDITLAYGFVDIASIVILAGILAGILAAFVIGLSKLIAVFNQWLVNRKKRAEDERNRQEALRIASLTLQEDDEERVVIQKLARNHRIFKALEGHVYRPQGQTKTANVFVLLEDSNGAGKVWVAPAIHLMWKDGQTETAKAFAALYQSSAPEDGVKLAALVEESFLTGNVMLNWAPTVLAGPWPRLVASTEFVAKYSDEGFLG
jgi:hypothetical protein